MSLIQIDGWILSDVDGLKTRGPEMGSMKDKNLNGWSLCSDSFRQMRSSRLCFERRNFEDFLESNFD